jgi:hypothetical protein
MRYSPVYMLIHLGLYVQPNAKEKIRVEKIYIPFMHFWQNYLFLMVNFAVRLSMDWVAIVIHSLKIFKLNHAS